MKTILVILCAVLCLQAQTKFGDGPIIPTVTVGTLPSVAGANGKTFYVSDGQTASDCTLGGGSTIAICRSNGSTWVSVGGGGSSFDPSATYNITGTIQPTSGIVTANNYSGASSTLPSDVMRFLVNTGAPGIPCVAGQTVFLQSDGAPDGWYCVATNTWYKMMLTANTGPFWIEGLTGFPAGVGLATPTATFARPFLDSGSKTLKVKDDAGLLSTTARAKSVVAGSFLSAMDADGNFSQAAVSGVVPNVGGTYNCSAGITAGTYADLQACVTAVVAAGGGTAELPVPGTYTVTTATSPSGLKLGSLTSIGDSTNTKVILKGGPGVVLDCFLTNYADCIRLADGSAIIGPTSYSVSASGTTFKVIAHNTAGTHINNIIAPMVKDGSIQNNTVEGVYYVGNTTATVLQSVFDVKGLFSGTSYRNIAAGNPGNIDILHIHNPSNANLTLSGNVTGLGTTATVTTAASTTSERDGHHVYVDGTVTISGCTDTSFNGTGRKVLSILSNTQFTYQGAGALGASSANCVVHPVTVLDITSVIYVQNPILNCSGDTGCQPIVVNSYGGGATGDITFNHVNAEGQAGTLCAVLVSRDNDGQGGKSYPVTFNGTTHFEPDSGATTGFGGFCIANGVRGFKADLIETSGAGAGNTGSVVRITGASGTNSPVNVKIGSVDNSNWASIITAPNVNIVGTELYDYSWMGVNQPPAGDVCGAPTTFCVVEYFPKGGTTTTGQIGSNGLTTQAIGGGTFTASYPGHGKGVVMTTNAAAGGGGTLGLSSGSTSWLGAILGYATPWTLDWAFSLSSAALPLITDYTFYAGLNLGVADPPTSGVGCSYDTALAQTTWQFTSWNGGTVSYDTGVTVVAGTNYRCTIQGTGTSGKVTFTLRNSTTGAIVAGPRTFCPSGCDTTATLATASNLGPTLGLVSAVGGAGAAKAVTPWYMRIFAWGLTQ